jgi:hypothetical protein
MSSGLNLWGLAALIAGLLAALHTRRAAAIAAQARASRALPVFEGLIAAAWVLLGIAILAHSHALFLLGIAPAAVAAAALVAVFLGGLVDPDWGVQVWLKPFYQMRRRLGPPMPSHEEMVEEAIRVALMTLGTVLIGGVGVWLDLHTAIGGPPLAIGMLLGVAAVYLAVARGGGKPRR